MSPAQTKPTPTTTCPTTRAGPVGSSPISIPAITYAAAPSANSALACSPAGCPRNWRSSPIRASRRNATTKPIHCSMACSLPSHGLARNLGVLVEGVHRAQAVVAIGDDHLAVRLVAHQEDRREFLAFADLLLIPRHLAAAHAEQRQGGGAEDVFRLVRRQRRGTQLLYELRRGPRAVDQAQGGLRRRLVCLFRCRAPFDRRGHSAFTPESLISFSQRS